MPKTYNDPAKQKSREKQKEFIANNLLTFKKPENVKVVCFPGAEAKGEEALEIKEVYDPLGIPRTNITGLEADPEKAKRLRKANLGITVEQILDVDFFRKTERQFDIVSLDYTGQQTEDRLHTIEMLIGRQLLRRYSVLCTNFATKRESDAMKKALFHKHSRYAINPDREIISKEKDESRIHALEDILRDETRIDLQTAREAITLELIRILRLGKRNMRDSKILRSHPYAKQIISQIKEKMRALRQTKEYTERKDLLCEAGIFTPEEFDLLHTNPPLNSNIVQRNLLKGLSAYLRNFIRTKSGIEIPTQTSEVLADLLECQENEPYFPKKIERYAYNSNKNTMMFVDLFYLDDMKNAYSKLKTYLYAETAPFSIRWNPLFAPIKKVIRHLSKIAEILADADRIKIPERIYLGSSWQPPKRKEKISKDDAIDLLLEGCSPAEISECYAGFSKMQLAAFKAHYVTMGKKNDKNATISTT